MTITNRKNFVILLSLLLASCSSGKPDQQKIRIVDMQGKAHPVQTRIPEFNVQALASQGRFEQKDDFSKADVENKNNEVIAQNKYSESAPSSAAKNNNPAAINSPQKTQDFVDSAPANIDYGFVAPEPAMKASNQGAGLQTMQRPDELKEEDQMRTEVGVGEPVDNSQDELDLSDQKAAKASFVKSGKRYVMTHPKQEVESRKLKSQKVAKSAKGYFVQVGSFSNPASANRALNSMKKYHSGTVEEGENGDKTVYRALLGPFSNKQKAAELVRKITNSGHDAIIVRNK